MNTQTQTASNAPAQAKETAILFDANTKERFNPTVRDEIVSFIRVQMRSGEGIYKRLFGFIRQCSDYSTAKGTVHGAEAQVCKDEKVKNLNQLNKARDMALSSYITVKSNIFSVMEKADDLAEEQQALLDWLHEKEGANKQILPDGYLDIFHNRYADIVKGAAQFRKDSNEAKAAGATLQQKKNAWERAQAQAQAKALEQANQAGSGTQQGVRSGGGTPEVKLPEAWIQELNGLKGILAEMAAYQGFKDSEVAKNVPAVIGRCAGALDQMFKDYRQSVLDKSSQHAARPSEAVAAQQRGETGETPELPEVTEGDIPLTAEEEQYIKDNAPDGEEPVPSTKTA